MTAKETLDLSGADVDDSSWLTHAAQGPWRTIWLGEALDHASHPEAVLEAIRSEKMLSPSGELGLRFRNLGCADAIIRLLVGDVDSDNGKNPPRFTLITMRRMLARQGFQVTDLVREAATPGEVLLTGSGLDTPAITSLASGLPDSSVSSYVLRARLDPQASSVLDLHVRIAQLEEEIALCRRREADLERSVRSAVNLARRQREGTVLELEAAQAELEQAIQRFQQEVAEEEARRRQAEEETGEAQAAHRAAERHAREAQAEAKVARERYEQLVSSRAYRVALGLRRASRRVDAVRTRVRKDG